MLGIRLVLPLCVLASAAIVGTLHRWSDGAVLASRPTTLLLFAAALMACLVLAQRVRPRAARPRGKP